MIKTYGTFHVTRSALIADIKSLVNEYNDRTATDEEMMEIVSKWVENCGPQLLANPAESKTVIAKAVADRIGSRRAAVITACLIQLDKRK